MKVKPLADRVLIKPEEQNEKTSGGIIIPDNAKEKPTIGMVIEAGSGTRDEKGHFHPLEVKPGNRVLFGKWAGTEITLDGQKYVILNEKDILGILD